MKVKQHRVVQLSQSDPFRFARDSALVGVHEEWVFSVIGAWRWHLVDRHGERIKELVTKGYSIDFGGAAAPVGYGAVVVDYLMPAPDGPRSLLDVPPDADCIFCSHTLEHFVDTAGAVASMFDKLKPGGHVVIQVPSWRKQMLNAAHWDFHEADFCLEWESNAPGSVIRLDTLLESRGFVIELKDDWHDNVMVIARRPE